MHRDLYINFSATEKFPEVGYELKSAVRGAILATLEREGFEYPAEVSVTFCSAEHIHKLNLEFRGVEEAFIANIKSGESVYDASQNFKRGTVKSVAIESYSVLEYDSSSGEAVMKEHPNLKTLIITISVSAIYTEGEGYSINGERIAVGGKYAVRFANFTGTAYCTQVRLSSK